VPYDTESYVHRIGRTGRAGRKGEAILFIAPRERNMLRAIERATRQVIEPMNLPTVDAVNTFRIAKFKQRVVETVAQSDAKELRPVIEQLEAESGLPLIDIAAALAALAQGATPLLLGGKSGRGEEVRGGHPPSVSVPGVSTRDVAPGSGQPRAQLLERPESQGRPQAPENREVPHRPQPAHERSPPPETTRAPRAKSAASLMETFRIEVGSTHGIKPSNVVGAIANEAGIEGVHIGRVDIRDDHSFVDLPEGMPKQVFKLLQKVLVAGRELRISKVDEKPPKPPRAPAAPLKLAERKERKMLSRRITPSRSRKD
jgi:ATP-dependent RNA helicase DeaD